MIDFTNNRKFVEKEFEEAKWDLSSGLSVEDLIKNTRKYMEENPTLSMPIMRANIFKFILENAQIEINPNSIFADKTPMQTNLHRGLIFSQHRKPGNRSSPLPLWLQRATRVNRCSW